MRGRTWAVILGGIGIIVLVGVGVWIYLGPIDTPIDINKDEATAEEPKPTPAEQAQAANEAALEEAEATAQEADEIKSVALERLNREFDVSLCSENIGFSSTCVKEDQPIGMGDPIKVEKGSFCFLDDIFTGTQPADTGDYLPLYDPDGSGGVVIGLYQGTPDADCLTAFGDALGWGVN